MKSHREGNILWYCLYFESKKKKKDTSEFTKQKQTHRFMITSGEGRGRGMVREVWIDRSTLPYLFIFVFVFSFIFSSWRLITLQYCSGAIHWHESAMDLHMFPIPIPPPTSLPIPSLWVFPVHQHRALVSCIQPGLAIYFTLDNIQVSMLFSQIIPPSPSPTKSKSLFYTSVSLFLSCI